MNTRPEMRRRRGATLLEFALVAPMLLIMLMGIMEFGWMVKNQLTLANAAREGARAAAVGRSVTDIESRVRAMTASVPGAQNSLTVTEMRDNHNDADGYAYEVPLRGDACSGESCHNDAPAGAMIQVSVSVRHRSLTGIIPSFEGRLITVNVVMRREN